MIVITRALARLLVSVLRRSLIEPGARWQPPWLLCRTDVEGLMIYAEAGMVGVCYRAPGRPPPDAMAFNAAALEAIGGRRGDEPIVFEYVGKQKGRVRWQDGNAPRIQEFETRAPDHVPQCPALPKRWAPLPPSFLLAFDKAAQTAAGESAKFAMTRIQLHGKLGQIVATDSKQALLQSGFRFPWDDAVLVPSLRAFGLRELNQENGVRIGRTEKMVCLQAGPWTFFLGIDTTGRFPPVHDIIPKPKSVTCWAQIHPEDAQFLAEALPRLPGRKDECAPITLDLGRTVTVRARAAESETLTEIELARSTSQGTAQRLAINRDYVERALNLGLPELQVIDSAKPVVFRDKERLYLCMTLTADHILAPRIDALRISSATDCTAKKTDTVSDPQLVTPRRIPIMATRNNNHRSPQDHPTNGSPVNGADHGMAQGGGPNVMQLLSEVDQIRGVLQDALGRVNHLHGALRQFRRQGKAMEDAMKSLRGLNFTG
jgi:hypothetical protein